MLSALKIEWMKVKNYRTFWILLGITLISIPGINYMLYNIMDNSFPKGRNGGLSPILGSPFAFPDVWNTVTWNASLLFIIPALLIITLTTNEFTFKTHRQNIIDGWSRQLFISVKLIEILLLSLVCTMVIILTALGFGLIANKLGPGVTIVQGSRMAFFYFVEMLSYSMIAFLLSILIRRSGLAIGVFFIYMLAEQLVVGFLRNVYHMNWVSYLPEEVTDMLLPLPYAKAVFQRNAADWNNHIPAYLTVSAVYVILYCLFTNRRFVKTDL
jgi:hypothetical protein